MTINCLVKVIYFSDLIHFLDKLLPIKIVMVHCLRSHYCLFQSITNAQN